MTEFFSKPPATGTSQNPEDDFIVTITNDFVRVEHPNRQTEEVFWKDINEIRLITTDTGPFTPNVWIALIGDKNGCLIPQGAKGYEEVYEIVSRYDGFDFETMIKSMSSTDNEQFLLWARG